MTVAGLKTARCLLICLLMLTTLAVVQARGEGVATADGQAHSSRERIRSAVMAFISRNAPWEARQMTVAEIRVHQDPAIPGKAQLKVSAPKHTDWLGPVSFQVQVDVGGRVVKRVSVQATIEVWSDVVVSAKPLGRGQPLTAADIEVKRMNLSRVPADAVLDPQQVLGLRSNRPIAANTILHSSQFNIPPMVRRGDVVQLVAESDQLKVSASGIAQQDGGRGQHIKVKNLRSDKMIYARVLDADTAQVDF